MRRASAGFAKGRRQLPRGPILAALAAAWVLIGLLGTYSYVRSYSESRGFPQLKRATGVRAGHFEWVHFYSSALRRRAGYLVYLPTGYNRSRRYPVFFLLHGMPGRPQVYIKVANADVRLDNLVARHRMPPMILVFPDGRVGGSTFSDSEWANTPTGNYESYALDVLHDVDHRFSTVANRGARVIAGFSAGALGALNIALRHLGDFASVEAWSGPFSESRSGVFAKASTTAVRDFSPIDYVGTLRAELAAHPLQAFLYGGRNDGDSRRIALMAARLAASGASVRYARYRGGHDWQLWNGHIDQMLILAGRDATHPPQRLGSSERVRGPRAHGHRGRHTRHRAGHHKRHALRKSLAARHADARRRHRRHRARAGAATRQAATRSQQGLASVTSAAAGSPGHRLKAAPAIVASPRRADHPSGLGTVKLLAGLLLALLSAAAINLGFLLQQRGLHEGSLTDGSHWAQLRGAARNRSWIWGQALGWTGFTAQVAAVAIAPLSLVQAFAAGGLALSVPLAALAFGQRISRRQVLAVLVIAAALASLPIGLSGTQDHLQARALVASVAIIAAIALPTGLAPAPALRAIAAGLSYGAADAAIKAISVRWGSTGAGALLSVWAIVALLGTFGGFVAFQAALRTGGAVGSISLMNAFATLAALVCGLASFGESLGGGAVLTAHLLAVALVLACVPVLAAAQSEIGEEASARRGSAAVEPDAPRVEPSADGPARERAPNGEQQPFQPGTRPWLTAPQHVSQAQVSGQRERRLGSKQQQRDAEHDGQRGAPDAGQAQERESSDGTGREPDDDQAQDRLAIESGQLQERQGVADARTDREPVKSA